MVLGEKLGQATGKVTAIRTLPEGKLEMTFRGSGDFLGKPITDNGTHDVKFLEGNSGTRLKGDVILVCDDGSGMAVWNGIGLGKMTGPFPDSSYAVMGEFPQANGHLQRLTTVACIVEYKVNADHTYHWDAYEWKAA